MALVISIQCDSAYSSNWHFVKTIRSSSLTCRLIDSRFCFASCSAALIVASSESVLLLLNASLVRLNAYSLFEWNHNDESPMKSGLFTFLFSPEIVCGKFGTFPKNVLVEWQNQRAVSSSSRHLQEYFRDSINPEQRVLARNNFNTNLRKYARLEEL